MRYKVRSVFRRLTWGSKGWVCTSFTVSEPAISEVHFHQLIQDILVFTDFLASWWFGPIRKIKKTRHAQQCLWNGCCGSMLIWLHWCHLSYLRTWYFTIPFVTLYSLKISSYAVACFCASSMDWYSDLWKEKKSLISATATLLEYCDTRYVGFPTSSNSPGPCTHLLGIVQF